MVFFLFCWLPSRSSAVLHPSPGAPCRGSLPLDPPDREKVPHPTGGGGEGTMEQVLKAAAKQIQFRKIYDLLHLVSKSLAAAGKVLRVGLPKDHNFGRRGGSALVSVWRSMTRVRMESCWVRFKINF